MQAEKYDIVIEQGVDFELNIIWEDEDENPLSLAGYTAESQVRYQYNADDPIIQFDVEIREEETGSINISAPASHTEKMDRNGVWDIKIADENGKVKRLLMGKAKISREVTK